jgi:hypothetical protein
MPCCKHVNSLNVSIWVSFVLLLLVHNIAPYTRRAAGATSLRHRETWDYLDMYVPAEGPAANERGKGSKALLSCFMGDTHPVPHRVRLQQGSYLTSNPCLATSPSISYFPQCLTGFFCEQLLNESLPYKIFSQSLLLGNW